MWTRFLIAWLSMVCLLFAGLSAEGAVMCVRKADTGDPKDGAPIRFRSSCKAAEAQLDPVALGLRGPRGKRGKTGPTGAQGVPGTVLHLVDQGGQELGILIDSEGAPGTFATYIPELDVVANFKQDLALGSASFVPLAVPVYFEAANCVGPPLFEVSLGIPSQRIVASTPDVFGRYKVPWQAAPERRTLRSQNSYQSADLPCSNYQQPGFGSVVTLEPVTLPFDEPLAGPLSIHKEP